MNMYNMLFGVNKFTPVLLDILKLKEKYNLDTEDYRFRDINVVDNGKKIILYTRLGGGNRECFCYRYKESHESRGKKCYANVIETLENHSLYICDYNDNGDSTYAYFEFKVPEESLEMTDFINYIIGTPETVNQKFDDIVKEISHSTKESLLSDKRFQFMKPLLEILKEYNLEE